MRTIITLVSSLSVLILLPTCSSTSTTGNPLAPGGGFVDYRMSGDTLIVTAPLTVTATRYCNGDTLMTQIDTSGGDTSAFIDSLSGDTLRIRTAGSFGGNAWDVYVRISAGAGLPGTWALAGGQQGSGTLGDTITITSSQIIPYSSGPQSSFADQFIRQWNRCTGTRSCDSSLYAVTVTKVNDKTVRLAGDTSGEIVTVYQSAQGDMTYTSTNTAHAAFTHYVQPLTCPNLREPAWYQGFLTANAR